MRGKGVSVQVCTNMYACANTAVLLVFWINIWHGIVLYSGTGHDKDFARQ